VRVGYFQFDVVRGDPDANVSIIEAALNGARADLIVLPELCTTGYLFESADALAEFAEPLDGQTVARLSSLASSTETTLVFGVAERDGDELFNTAVIATPDGAVRSQRKRHLTRLEQPLFSVGGQVTTHQVPEATIGAVMCFDAWFPERSRILTQGGVQILCCPSNFGGPESLDVFKVRALENRVFVIVANRIGHEQLASVEATFRGDSRVITPDGTVLIPAGDGQALGLIDIDLGETAKKASVMSNNLEAEWSGYQIVECPPRLGI